MGFWGTPSKTLKLFSYCEVDHVDKLEETGHSIWDTHCADGSRVALPRVVQAGQGIYYVPYELNGDTTTVYGYIKEIQDIVQ